MHIIVVPAADELVEPPLKKLAADEEPAEPKSVAALDADWANATVGAYADSAVPIANTADKTASIVSL